MMHSHFHVFGQEDPTFNGIHLESLHGLEVIQKFWDLWTVYCTVSIKRPGFKFFQKSLLNLPYDPKNEGLNILLYRSYNRMMRVFGSLFWGRDQIENIFWDHPTFTCYYCIGLLVLSVSLEYEVWHFFDTSLKENYKK